MKNDTLTVAAVPDGQHFDLYCSQCGHLGRVPNVHRDQTVMCHLAGHGVNVPALYTPSPN